MAQLENIVRLQFPGSIPQLAVRYCAFEKKRKTLCVFSNGDCTYAVCPAKKTTLCFIVKQRQNAWSTCMD